MAGIDSLVNSRADMFAANPQGLQQRYAMNQDLLDLLALQKLKKDKEAAQRSLQMQMQAPQGTVKDQLSGQVMDMTKQEVAASLAPGIQQMGQRMAAEQAQRAMSGGLPTQPAPNMVGMARGGIVGYAPGGDVEGEELTEEYLASLPPAERLRAIQRARLNARGDEDIARGENILRSAANVRNMPSEAPAGLESILSEGTPPRDIPVSMDALRTVDARRDAERRAAAEARASRLTGDPIADDIIQSRRAAEYMTPEQTEYLGRRREEPSRPSRLMDDLGAAAIAEGGMGIPQLGRNRTYTPLGPDASLARKPESTPYTAEVGPQQNVPRLPEGYRFTQRQRRAVAPQEAPVRSGIAAALPTDRRSAEEAAMDAYDVRANQYQATDEDLASMLGEDLTPTRSVAAKDPRMSRYEDQLARLEAEEKDKLGSLIDFLLAAGASGGTNLGATLMGGGTGLQAREQRIKDEMVKTIQNIETLQLEREQMAAEDERARLSRETQLAVARLQNQAQRPTDMQSRVAAYKAQIMAANPEMSEVQATAKAYEQIQAEDIALAQASAGLGLPQRQSEQKADLRIQAQENALEYLRSQGNFMPSSQEIDAETNRQYQALIAAAGIAPEPGQSTAPQRQVELSPEDRALIESWLPKQGT